MYISRVRLENIRGFTGPRNVDLTLTRPDGSHAGWTVIAGRNGSGKSTLLHAIALAVAGPDSAFGLLPGFKNWVSIDHFHGLSEVELHWDEDYDQWAEVPISPPTAFRAALRWYFPQIEPARQTGPADSSGRRTSPTPIISTAGELPDSGPWQANPIGWFCVGYGPFRRLVGGSADAQRLMAAPGPVGRLATLFHEDASLAESVQWLIDQHLRAFENRPGAETLKRTALRILADGLLPDQYEIADVDSEGLWVISDDHRLPLREMSDGYRTIAALVVDLLKQLDDSYGSLAFGMRDGTPTVSWPGVVIIDEVDAHLHVSWQKRIGGWLKAHFPNIQFIVTTHSPYICQAADEGGLIRLSGPKEATPPQVVDQDLYQRIVYGSGEDAVLSELFGLDSPYSEQADELRKELAALEAKVVRGHATDDEIALYKDLRHRLTSSPAARVVEVAEQLRASSQSQE